MPPAVEVVLLFDNGGVLTSAAVPAARRLAEIHMRIVFERASQETSLERGGDTPADSPGSSNPAAKNTTGVTPLLVPTGPPTSPVVAPPSVAASPKTLAKRYSNIYFMVSHFTQRMSHGASAWMKLETGLIRRNEFIATFQRELRVFLNALSAGSDEELAQLKLRCPAEVGDWKRRNPHLVLPEVQRAILETLDAESFLNVLERVTPRKNVLNLLHYLRNKTHQEIKLGVVTNNWESEGHYIRSSVAVEQSGSPQFVHLACPIEYGDQGGTFDVNGLFDVVAQSYLVGKAKPAPDIFLVAIESVVGKDNVRELVAGKTPSTHPSPKPLIFFFDDMKANCVAAEKLPGLPCERAFLISNGPRDVFTSVREAIAIAASKDPYWKSILDGLDHDIAPLFSFAAVPASPTLLANPAATSGAPAKPGVSESKPAPLLAGSPTQKPLSWVEVEYLNADNNLLFLPPPPNPLCERLDDSSSSSSPSGGGGGGRSMDLEERNRILFHLSRVARSYFPFPHFQKFEDSGNLCEDGGFATSSGPVIWERFRGGMSNPTFRFTCRTGSYVLRKQPRGRLLPGAHSMKREYELIRHLAANSNVPVPKCVAFCSDPSVCPEDFYVMRYRDGRIVRQMKDLAAAPFSRPFSQSRVLAKTTLNPKLFFRQAIETLVLLHQAPVPSFLLPKNAVEGEPRAHPLLRIVRTWTRQYQRALTTVVGAVLSKDVMFPAFEYLGQSIEMAFTHAVDGGIPMPERMCLTHGDYKIDNIMFSHRSLEGRTKYPPKIVLLLDYELASYGDPLTDVAYLSLFHYLPSPRGTINLPTEIRKRFPTPVELLEHYCHRAGYLANLTAEARQKVFHVYMAVMCYKLAGIAHGVVVRGFAGNATEPEQALRLGEAVDYLSRVGCMLLGVEAPGEPRTLSKM